MLEHPGCLDIPTTAREDAKALEIGRIWATRGVQEVSLRVGIWKDPAAWGLMFADLARHVANAYEQSEGRDRREVLARIKKGFEVDWPPEFDTTSGSVG